MFIYFILKEVSVKLKDSVKLKYSVKFIYLSLLLFAVDPNNIYLTTIAIRQLIAWLFFTIILFILIKILINRDKSFLIPLFLMSISIVYTHHWSSAMLIITLIGIAILKFLHGNKTFILLSLILIISAIIWWTTYGQIIWNAPLFKSVSTFRFDIAKGLHIISYPIELTPSWTVLLYLRNILLYIPSIIGWFILYKKYKSSRDKLLGFLLTLFVIAIIIALLNLISEGGLVLRSLIIMNVIIVIMTSFAYFNLFNYIRIKTDYIFIIFVFICTITFFGLWSNTYLMLHLYDKSIDEISIGEHNYRISASQIIKINNILDSTYVDKILTDNIYLLVSYSKPELYNKIMLLYQNIPTKEQRSIVISTDNLYVYKYFEGSFAIADSTERVLIKDMLYNRLKTFDRIYSDSSGIRIWH
jgi:hypothetical protein